MGPGHRVRVDHPAGAEDWQVEIDDDRTPFLVILSFVTRPDARARDADPGWFCTGFELRRRPGTDPAGVTAEVHRYFADQWGNFESVARSALEFSVAEAVRETAALRARGQGRRGLSDEFYRGIAEQYRQLAGERRPTSTIAQAHEVSRSTASNWIAGARERGYLEPATPGRAG